MFILNGDHEQNDRASVANLPRAVGLYKLYVDKMRWVGDQKTHTYFFQVSSFKFISFNILSTFSDLFKDSIRKYISYYIVMTNKKECFPISKFSP